MFFDTWSAFGRIALTAIVIYLAVVIFLRVTGKRTLSKWNAFDFIVTIALGSTLAASILSKDTAIFEGILGLGLLMGLQFVVTWLSVRSSTVRRLLKSQPTLLLHEGQFQREAMRRERVTESEVRAALRSHGVSSVEHAAAVVLETDGNFSVITEQMSVGSSTLVDVVGIKETYDR